MVRMLGTHLTEPLTSAITQLNRQGVIPDTMYKRNHLAYELISYVNNATGCLICRNYNVVALFLSRSADALARLRKPEYQRPAEELAYFDFVENYLRAVGRFLCAQNLPPTHVEMIPPAWR
jgi:hypothetical protein